MKLFEFLSKFNDVKIIITSVKFDGYKLESKIKFQGLLYSLMDDYNKNPKIYNMLSKNIFSSDILKDGTLIISYYDEVNNNDN